MHHISVLDSGQTAAALRQPSYFLDGSLPSPIAIVDIRGKVTIVPVHGIYPYESAPAPDVQAIANQQRTTDAAVNDPANAVIYYVALRMRTTFTRIGPDTWIKVTVGE